MRGELIKGWSVVLNENFSRMKFVVKGHEQSYEKFVRVSSVLHPLQLPGYSFRARRKTIGLLSMLGGSKRILLIAVIRFIVDQNEIGVAISVKYFAGY